MLKNKKIDFAFLLHPRRIEDVSNRYPFTTFLPKSLLEKIFNLTSPLVVATMEGLKDADGNERRGVAITLPLTAEQMLKNRDEAKLQVIKAIKKAHKLGAKQIGLGAFTSVVTSGGLDVANVVQDVHVTNGNALTAYISYLGLKKLIEKHPNKIPVITVIGATGSIGSVITEFLIEDGCFEKLYIVGKTPSKIESLLQKLSLFTHFSKVFNVKIEEALPESDIVFSATSAHGAVIDANIVKKGAFIYDITQPKNVTDDLLKRKDVKVFNGGIIKLPDGVKISNRIGTRKGEVFACLAETMLLSLIKYPDNFCLGKVTKEHVVYIAEIAKKYRFNQSKIEEMV